MSNFRPIVGHGLTPIQQSLAIDRRDQKHQNTFTPMIGCILEVHPSDIDHNRSAAESIDRRGFLHECTVLITESATAAGMILDHVVIPPPTNSGLDDYHEHLPRGTTSLIDGSDLPTSLLGVNPFDLDGDWCVVGFIGGSLDRPFILSWWPHPRNYFDPSTSGAGNPDSQGQGQALNQAGRYFRRINGVEHVITNRGDIYLDTRFANSSLQFGTETQPTEGRFSRIEDEDDGGSVMIQVKPSQVVEVSFDASIDGQGLFRGPEEELPQTNPQTNRASSSGEREATYVRMDQNQFRAEVPEDIVVSSARRINISCDEETFITSTNTLELESGEIKHGANAEQGIPRGNDLKEWLRNLTVLTATGPARINPQDIETFDELVLSTKNLVE
jgi:hypothetical protein